MAEFPTLPTATVTGKVGQKTMTEPKQRTNWTARLIEAAAQMEERNKVVEVVRVLYPASSNVTVKIDGSLRSFDTVRRAALHLEEGLRWI